MASDGALTFLTEDVRKQREIAQKPGKTLGRLMVC
jgi:hypothetical protein